LETDIIGGYVRVSTTEHSPGRAGRPQLDAVGTVALVLLLLLLTTAACR
jgi:replicative superfamily II helicase